MPFPRAAALSVILATFALPSGASAEIVVSKTDPATVSVAETSAAADRVSVATTSETVTISAEDAPTELTAGDGCQETQPDVVTCSATGVTKVVVQLWFSDDTLLPGTGSLRREVHASYGNDVVHDQPGDDLLSGGPGDDRFHMYGGDDEVIGDADEAHGYSADDELRYAAYSAGVNVTLPSTGTSTGNGAGAENDTISGVEHLQGSPHADHLVGNDVHNYLSGGDGGDKIEGSGGGDTLYADDISGGSGNDDELSGGAGRDHLWAQDGSDVLDGGPDGDWLNAVDDPLQADQSIDCGDGGDDTLDADNLTDPAPTGCEIVAPEFYEHPELLAVDEFMEGHWAVISGFSVTGGTLEDELNVDWFRCPPDDDCDLRQSGDSPGYWLTSGDVDSLLYAVVTISNPAGSDTTATGDSPIIEPGLVQEVVGPQAPPQPPAIVRLPPVLPPPYADYGDDADALEQRLRPIEAAIGRSLRSLARRWTGDDPRSFARRRFISHRVTFPETGELSLTWTATIGGTHAAAARRVTIARGRARGSKGRTRTVRVRPTRLGRAVLRRARSLRMRVAATFVGGPATAAAPAETRLTLRLRRRSEG